jgi:uncharacterized protein (TIGR02466 family)
MASDLKILFGTPVWTFDLTEKDKQLNTMVMMDGENFSMYISNNKKENKPIDISGFFEFPGYGITLLRKYVLEAIEKIRQDRGLPNVTPEIRARRKVIQPLECDTPHHHIALDLVGVYYNQVPENSGDLLLYETRGSINYVWQDPSITTDAWGRSGRVVYRIKPEVGKLIMFPNYLFHSVETNLSNSARISIVLDIRLLINE